VSALFYNRRMKKLFVPILLLVTLIPFRAQTQQSSGTLAAFLSKQGLAGAKLERRFGNHLFVPVSINNRNGALMIDTGSPVTVIDTNSANTFGLTVEKTGENVGGLFGRSWERYGTSKVASIAMGNCVLTNVPVAISDISGMNIDISGPSTGSHLAGAPKMAHLNGILGTREMDKFGMIIDCTRQMLYVNPNGPSSAVSRNVAGFFLTRRFTQIPMRLNANYHFDVDGAINGHSTRFIVDTGSGTTLIDKQTAVKAGVSPAAVEGMAAGGAGGLAERSSGASIKDLAIGGFKIADVEVEVAHVSSEILRSKSDQESNAGVLGIEYLSRNFAVIDMGGKALYLRHPDLR
jgi:predicted aspartyl protease